MIPIRLIENFAHGLCVPWVGAGISKSSDMPSWEELVRKIIETTVAKGLPEKDSHELNEILQTKKIGAYEDVVDFCRNSLGEGDYRNFLRKTLDENKHPNELHSLIANWKVPAIITSNYDRLLENALTLIYGRIPSIYSADDTETLWQSFAKEEFFLLKAHGDINRPQTVILASNDYTKHVFGNYPFMTFMQRIILSKSIFFLGSSLQDIYIRRIFEETNYLTKGVGMTHYALMPNIGSIQSRLLRERFNIEAISFDPNNSDFFTETRTILNEISQQVTKIRM